MCQIKIGDFVTGYGSGYWQLIDVKPKVAMEDDIRDTVCRNKGEIIGQWAILKKCFTNKMKPRIDFSYEDFAWVKPVDDNTLIEIQKYFEYHPEYKQKFDVAAVKLQPMIRNCWLALPEAEVDNFKAELEKLPAKYSMDEFWKVAQAYKKYVSNPPAGYLLNFSAYPWDVDESGDLIYSGLKLVKN